MDKVCLTPPNGYQIVGYYVHFVFAFTISRWVFFLIHVKMNNKRQTIVRCIVEAGVVLPYVNIPIFV